MRKALVICLPIGTIIFFVLIMLSGSYLKMPIGKDDSITDLVQVLINNVNNEEWEEANYNTDKLSEAWDKIVRRVQFSAERDEINDFAVNVERLRGAIMAKDKGASLSELYEAHEHWRGLGK